jgi:hypothetical protein
MSIATTRHSRSAKARNPYSRRGAGTKVIRNNTVRAKTHQKSKERRDQKPSHSPSQKDSSKEHQTISHEALITASPVLLTQDAVDAMNVNSASPTDAKSKNVDNALADVRLATLDSGEMVQKAMETTSNAVEKVVETTGIFVDKAIETTRAALGMST